MTRHTSSARPWYARARSAFESIGLLRSSRQLRNNQRRLRTRLSVSTLEDRIVPFTNVTNWVQPPLVPPSPDCDALADPLTGGPGSAPCIQNPDPGFAIPHSPGGGGALDNLSPKPIGREIPGGYTPDSGFDLFPPLCTGPSSLLIFAA
jgi:hypothetical protein